MQVRECALPGLLEITPRKVEDERGYFSEIFRNDRFAFLAGDIVFVQDNESLSVRQGTIRGIHFQSHPHAQGKLVRCLAGSVFDVAVDLRHGSPTFGQWEGLILSPNVNNQFWIPAGFGHAFCTLQPDSIVSYRVTSYYSAEHDCGIAWNDPDIGIRWPEIADITTLSAKDRAQPAFSASPAYFSVKD